MIAEIKDQIHKIEFGEYGGVNGEKLFAMDIQELRGMIDTLSDSLNKASSILDGIIY